MLISSVQDKKGDGQESETVGHSEGFLRCVMSDHRFELNLGEVNFGDDVTRTVDSDLDLFFKPRETHQVLHEKPSTKPRRHVETIIHDDDSGTDMSDDEIYEGIQQINILNNKIYKILNSARATGYLYNNIGFAIPSDLETKYDNTIQGQAAYTKDLLHSLNTISGDAMTSCLPKSLFDFISSQSDDSTGVYMESVITHVNRTIEQLRKISNGDYLTERTKEMWREVYDYPLPNRAALTHFDQSLIARCCDPLPFNTEPITWNAIVHSDINSKTFDRIFDRKIVIEIPKEIRCNFFNRHMREGFVNCKMNSPRHNKNKYEGKNEETILVVELQSSVIEGTVDNNFDRIFIKSGPPPFPALENRIIPQIQSIPNSPVSDEQNSIDAAQVFENAKDPSHNNSSDEIFFINEYYENFNLVPNSNDSGTPGALTECHASMLSSMSSQVEETSSPIFLGETIIVSNIDLTTTMQKINKRFPAIEEYNEESPTNKKVNTPPKVRIKSPYENMKFFMEEKRRKKLLEIRQKREQKKRFVVETKELKSKAKTTPAPQTCNSVTKLSITNKSFYNSIFGHKIRHAVDPQKSKYNPIKKETDLQIPNNSEEDEVEDALLSTNECRIVHRSCYMDDAGTEVALLPNHADNFSSSVDDEIKELLRGTDEVPVKLNKMGSTPRSPSPPITTLALKPSKIGSDLHRNRSPVNIKSRFNHARHKISVLECRKSIEKVYEFLHIDSVNDSKEITKKAPKTVSFSKPFPKKVEELKTKPKSLQQLSKPLNIGNTSPPPLSMISPARLDSPRSPARMKETTPRKPKPPSIPETVIKNPILSIDKKKKVVKKLFPIDDDREARDEAIRGPSITARLNALAQPRKPYVKAFNEELQQKAVNFRTMTVNRQISQSPSNKESACPMPRYRQIRGGIDTMSSMSFRRPAAISDRRSRLGPSIPPRPSSPLEKVPPVSLQTTKPVDIGIAELNINRVKKVVSFKEDLKTQQTSENTSPTIVQEIPPPSTSAETKPNMMLRLPTCQDLELLSTPSSKESFVNEDKHSPCTSSTKVDVFNDSDLKGSTSNLPESSDTFKILSQESLMLKEIFSDTAAFSLDIFRDKTVSTAVEAVENDAFNNQHIESHSISELDKLEDALQKQITGSTLKKRLIKNFTLTPKHSMQQVLLLHSGDTGSCIASLKTPAPSCIKITTSKSDTFAELGVFPLVSNYDFNRKTFSFPMQIATVGYAFPQQLDMEKIRQKRRPLNTNTCRNPSPGLTIRSTPKVSRDVKKKTLKNSFKDKKISESVIKTSAVYNEINVFKNIKKSRFETMSSTKLNTKYLKKCATKSAENITIMEADTKTTPNDDSTSSLDILVRLLSEIQKISTSQTRIASVAKCQSGPSTGNKTNVENSRFLLGSFDNKSKKMESITTLEQMRQLDSTPSLFSFLISSEADIYNRIKTPLYINKEIGVNFPDKQLVSKYADVNFQTITVNNTTNVSESFLKLIEIHRPVLHLTENVTQYSETLILDRVLDNSNIQHFNLDSNNDIKRSNDDVLSIGDVTLDEFEEEIFEKMVEEVIEEEKLDKKEVIATESDKNDIKPKEDHTAALLKRIDEILASKTTRELKIVKDFVATRNLISKQENKLESRDYFEFNPKIVNDDCANTEINLKNTEYSKIDKTDYGNFDPELKILEDKKNDSLNTKEQGVEQTDSLIKIKRDILVTVYSVLAVTVFAALSLPEVLYFSDLNV